MDDAPTTPGVFNDTTTREMIEITEPSSAVAVFIGSTSRAVGDAGESLSLTPTRVSSVLDFERRFGVIVAEPVRAVLRSDPVAPAGVRIISIEPSTGTPVGPLAWAVRHYFDSGGLDCFVVSVGDSASGATAADLIAGVNATVGEPAITTLVVPEAATMRPWSDYRDVSAALLAHCATVPGRFAILDVWRGDISVSDSVDISSPGFAPELKRVIDASRAAWTGDLTHAAAYYPFLVTNYPRLQHVPDAQVAIEIDGRSAGTLDALKVTAPLQFAAVRKAIDDVRVLLPPSGAVAGIYAQTDRTRGVWKAPSNVSINATTGPAASVNEAQQSDLLADISGKSVNPIRAMVGRGTLVWGARTVAGTSGEWRYVSVRRLVDTIERSILTSTRWVVDGPNTAATWSALVTVIQNYLTTRWRNGALLGSKPEQAFWVQCGLGQTMTAADVSGGRLVVKMGLAPVRPGEFIIRQLTYML